MAQSRSFLDDVKRELECSVCHEQFSEINEPKILKCLHTFCKSCLEAWLRQQREGAALSCPTCRQITECPNNNINRLPSNLFCKQMVEIVEAYSGQGQEDSPHCANCDEKKSLKFYCSDCNCFLCEDCSGLHKKWKDFSGHHIKEIGNFESSDARDYARRANVCKQHNDEVRFYCEQCVICICRDCAILEHRDHNIVSLDKGLEKKKSEIENKMRAVQTNGSSLRNQKDSLEKQRMRMNNSIEQATEEVHRAAKRNIELIRQHEASVTEQLIKQKETFQAEFSNTVTSLDEKLMEIESSLDFGNHVLERNNLAEILNVEEVLEQRFQELLEPSEFGMKLNYSGVRYVPNDLSSLKEPPGKLFATSTEPSLSLAEGMGLTEGIQGEDCTFKVITMDSQSKKTYSEIDRVDVDIQSPQTGTALKANITDTQDGCYKVSYKPEAAGEFNVLITVASEAIKGSPFQLKVKESKIEGRKNAKRAESIDWQLAAEIQYFEMKNEELKESKDHEQAIDADPLHSSRGVRSKYLLETYIGLVKVSVYKGDLTSERVDVIVNAANDCLRHDGGVAKAILDRGGKVIQKESNKIIQQRGPLKGGEAVATKAGKLPCKMVVHAVGPEYRNVGMSQSKTLLRRVCLNSLTIAQKSKMTSIALPAIGSGAFGMPIDACAEVMFNAVEEFVRQGDPKEKSITDVRFVNIDDSSVQAFRKEFSRYDNNQEHSKSDKLTGGGSFKFPPTGAEGGSSMRPSSRPDRDKNRNSRTTTDPSDLVGGHHPLSGSTTYSGAVKKTPCGNDARPSRVQEPGGAEGGMIGFFFRPRGKEAATDRKDEGAGSETECPICLGTVTNARTLKCEHVFCTECVETALKDKNRCPVCKVQDVIQGNQPKGEMRFHRSRQRLPGHYDCDMIIIDYFFPSGTQGPEHPNPGQRYDGTQRTAYLPGNQEGSEVLQLLKRAFDARLVFTVGTSVTTGQQNQVTWNDIHHKTNISGGPQGFGYPDPDYLRRVKEDLAAKGIR